MLTHAKPETTDLYTQVSIQKLKEIHELTHPAAQNEAGKAKEVADELKVKLKTMTTPRVEVRISLQMQANFFLLVASFGRKVVKRQNGS